MRVPRSSRGGDAIARLQERPGRRSGLGGGQCSRPRGPRPSRGGRATSWAPSASGRTRTRSRPRGRGRYPRRPRRCSPSWTSRSPLLRTSDHRGECRGRRLRARSRTCCAGRRQQTPNSRGGPGRSGSRRCVQSGCGCLRPARRGWLHRSAPAASRRRGIARCPGWGGVDDGRCAAQRATGQGPDRRVGRWPSPSACPPRGARARTCTPDEPASPDPVTASSLPSRATAVQAGQAGRHPGGLRFLPAGSAGRRR